MKFIILFLLLIASNVYANTTTKAQGTVCVKIIPNIVFENNIESLRNIEHATKIETYINSSVIAIEIIF